MKHIWSILCQKSSVDIESNLLSLFNCAEEINLIINQSKTLKDGVQAIKIELELVSFWITEGVNKNEDDILEIKIELLDPDKKILSSSKNKLNIKKGIQRFRNRIKIEGLYVSKEGRYTFNVWAKSGGKKEHKLVAELPLDIKIAYKFSFVNKKSSK